MGNHELRFRASQLHTGAEVTAVSTSTWKSLNLSTQLMKPDIYLYGPDRSQLKLLGMLPVSLCYRDNSCTQIIYVIDELKNNLLGLPAIKELKLLANVCSKEYNVTVSLFVHWAGNFHTRYKIKLNPNAKLLPLVLLETFHYH